MQCSDRSRPSQDSQSNNTIFSTAFIQINKIEFPIDSHSNSAINIICFYQSWNLRVKYWDFSDLNVSHVLSGFPDWMSRVVNILFYQPSLYDAKKGNDILLDLEFFIELTFYYPFFWEVLWTLKSLRMAEHSLMSVLP